jgi:hypothetical protein
MAPTISLEPDDGGSDDADGNDGGSDGDVWGAFGLLR